MFNVVFLTRSTEFIVVIHKENFMKTGLLLSCCCWYCVKRCYMVLWEILFLPFVNIYLHTFLHLFGYLLNCSPFAVRINIDLNAPVSQICLIDFRLSFEDYEDNETYHIAPQILWNKLLNCVVEIEIQHQNIEYCSIV